MIMVNIKTHWFAIVLSVVVGLVMIGPQLIFVRSLSSAYRGIYMMRSDAEVHYLARMEEFIDGNGLGNAYLYEYKNSIPSIFFTISESVLAIPARIFHIPVPTLNLFYKFFLPFVISLLAYSFLFRLTRTKAWSLAGTSVIMLGNILLSIPHALDIIYHNFTFSQFSLYARPINPEFSSILFFSYLHVFWAGVLKKEWKWFIASGLILGLSFYVYFYSYTFLIALNIIFAIMYFTSNDRNLVKKILIATGGGIVLGIPVLINAYNVYHNIYYVNAARISAVVYTHAFRVSTLGMIVIFLFGWYVWRGKIKTVHSYFLAGLLITTFVAINQQVVTGVLIHEDHYHWYFNVPIFLVTLTWLAWNLFGKLKNKIIYPLLLAVFLVSLYGSLFVQYSSYRHSYDYFAENQDYMSVFDWLKQYSSPESVVLANVDLSLFIPVYTQNNVYWSPYAAYYLVPTDDIEQRLFLFLKLYRYKNSVNDEMMRKYLLTMSQQNPDLDQFVGNDVLSVYPSGLAARYDYFLKHFADEQDKVHLDYIVVDNRQNPAWDLSGLKLILVFSDDKFRIFQVIPQ